MRDTPRTDDVMQRYPDGKLDTRGFVNAEFARGLERELARATLSRDNLAKVLQDAYTQINHPWQAGKVWAKYPREQINALLKTVREALVALK